MKHSFSIPSYFLLTFLICQLLFVQCKQAPQQIVEPALKHLVREGNVPDTKSPALILLHGYRSNEVSFFSLAKSVPQEFTVISVQAPISKGPKAYAWYNLDMANGLAYDPAELEQARLQVIEFIEQATKKYNLDTEQIYLSGFSQGGIMSYAVGLTRPDLVKGIAPLSGRLSKETKEGLSKNKALKTLKVFIAHGTKDNVISVEEARTAKDFLLENGITPTYVEDDLAHSVNDNILRSLITWLKQ